jgi:hypothetical protein
MQNQVGSRWMGLNIRGYGIHGCIRMGKSDVVELFSVVKVGDTVVNDSPG